MRGYSWLVRNVLFPLDRWRTGDHAELRYLKQFEETQYLPPEDIEALQWERLQTILWHAYRECPFYRERFDRAELHPRDIRSAAELALLPVLEKGDIQENRDRMIATTWPRDDLVPNQTGGSTGRPLSFFVNRERMHSRAAATIRHNRWAGWDIGDKVAVIWGAARDVPPHRWKEWVRNLLIDRRLFLDAGHVTEARLADFHEALKRFRPRVILGYAGAVVLFARFLKTRSATPYQPQGIITSAEVLEPSDRALVEQVFGCRVFNRYGCREASVVASECEAHQGLHTMAEGLYIEVVKNEAAARPGELGSILITDLLNRAMPLVRYRVGDLGSWEAGTCACGRGLPRLKSVAGRVTDFLVGSDGRLVSGAFLTISLVAHRPSLGQVQILQEKAGQVLFRIHPGRTFDPQADLDYLHDATRRYLGNDTVIDWEYVEELKPEPSGKFIFSRSAAAVEFLSRPTECSAQA